MEEELKRLISENKVIPFVGAGVSKAVKFKNGQDAFINWKELLESFLNDITDKDNLAVIKAMLNVKNIDYLEVADKIEKEYTLNDFNKILKQSLSINYNHIDEDTYTLAKSIWNLGSKLIITTNYDKVLHNACEDKNIDFWDITSLHEQGNYARDGVKDPTVWNLHGNISNVDNVILTTHQYKKLYTDELSNSDYKASLQLLQTIISSKSLLFIGFSLDDVFIINQLNKIIEIFGGNNPEHYVLIKKGSNVDTLNGNIKVIEYEDHGQALIDKIYSLKPMLQTVEEKLDTKIIIEQEDTSRHLTTLPPKNDNFIGRVEDLQTIEEQLEDDSIIYIVNGIGGVGKSELSCEYFHRNKHRYKSIAFMEFTKDTSSIEELFYVKFKEQFNLNEDATLENIIRKLQGLPSKNLLLLDNLESKEDFEKIRALNTNFDLLITTRITDIEATHQLYLDTLNDEDAKELFLSIYNQDENIEDILEYLDNHPLFINLTARSLEKEYITLEELRDDIQNDNVYKIDSKDDKTFQQHLVDRFSKQFIKEDNKELKELLQILAVFPSIEIDFKILEKSIGKEKLRVKLQKLVERGWLSKKENSYKLHQIIKVFIQTDYPIEYKNITFIFENIAKYINPDDSTLIVNKLDEYKPIIESFLNAYKGIKDEYICGILDSITYLYYSSGKYKKALNVQHKSLYIRSGVFGINSFEVARNKYLLAIIYRDINQLDAALEHQIEAVNIQEKDIKNHFVSLALSYTQLGSVYSDKDELDKALFYQNKAITIQEENEECHKADLSKTYNNIATVYQKKNDMDNALMYQKKALKIAEEVFPDNHGSIAIGIGNISNIYKAQGKLLISLKYQLKAMNILENTLPNMHPILVRQYANLANIYLDLKECKKALTFYKKSLGILEQLEYKHPDYNLLMQNLKFSELQIKKQKKAGYRKKGKFCIDM